MLLQNTTEDLCARPHEDEIWNANTSHVALSPSLHQDYEPQLPEMSTPRTPWDTLLNLVLADAQESFAYKEKSNTSTEECYCLPASQPLTQLKGGTSLQPFKSSGSSGLGVPAPHHRRCHPGAGFDASTEHRRLPAAHKRVPHMSLELLLLFTLCGEQTFSMTLHTKG